LFCVPKAWVLHGKTGSFASQNSCYCNTKTQLSLFNRIIFTMLKRNPAIALLACGSCIRGINLCVVCRFAAVSSGELALKKHLRDCLFKDNPADVFVISSSDQTVTIERKIVS